MATPDEDSNTYFLNSTPYKHKIKWNFASIIDIENLIE